MRGKGLLQVFVSKPFGITPAYAGKSKAVSGSIAAVGDHPRVCGEKLLTTHLQEFLSGSPPRMRGKEYWPFFWRFEPGITPACAGKSRYRSLCVAVCRDHPRVCGEKE